MNNNILESLRQDYYVSEKIELNQKGLFANRNYKMGEVISDFSSSEILDHPTYLTVQLNEVDHILLHPIDLQYINHSCSPNSFFNTSTMKLEALKDIAKSDEFTFFYPSTEWDMDQAFLCRCGETSCIREVKGAKYLSIFEFEIHRFSNYIHSKYLSFYSLEK
jgi:hypothetical protein